jgi:hypothetical protein
MPVGRCSWELFGRKLHRKIKKSQALSGASHRLVHRLRATKLSVWNRSAKRVAQDDGFVGGLEYNSLNAENTKRSK